MLLSSLWAGPFCLCLFLACHLPAIFLVPAEGLTTLTSVRPSVDVMLLGHGRAFMSSLLFCGLYHILNWVKMVLCREKEIYKLLGFGNIFFRGRAQMCLWIFRGVKHLKIPDRSPADGWLCSILWGWKCSTLPTAEKTVSFSVCCNVFCPQTHTRLSWLLLLSFHNPKMSESVLGTYAYSYEVQGHSLTPKIIWKYCPSGNSNTGAPGGRGELWFGGGEGWREVGSKYVCTCAHVKAIWQP